VRRERVLVDSGRKDPTGNWIAPPGSIGAAVEKALRPPVERYAKKFSGKRTHRIIKGIGHNLPQEAPQAFAEAILDVDGH